MYAFKNSKDKDVLLELLKQKPDLNIQNNSGVTATIYAFTIFYQDKDVLLKLLKQKPNLTLKNNKNKTALDYALKYYVKNSNFDFNVLEELYNENHKQNTQLKNLDYLRIRRKYKVLPLVLFRHHKMYI